MKLNQSSNRVGGGGCPESQDTSDFCPALLLATFVLQVPSSGAVLGAGCFRLSVHGGPFSQCLVSTLSGSFKLVLPPT